MTNFVSGLGVSALLEQMQARDFDAYAFAAEIARGCGFDRFRASLLMQDVRHASLHLAIAGLDLRERIRRVSDELGV